MTRTRESRKCLSTSLECLTAVLRSVSRNSVRLLSLSHSLSLCLCARAFVYVSLNRLFMFERDRVNNSINRDAVSKLPETIPITLDSCMKQLRRNCLVQKSKHAIPPQFVLDKKKLKSLAGTMLRMKSAKKLEREGSVRLERHASKKCECRFGSV